MTTSVVEQAVDLDAIADGPQDDGPPIPETPGDGVVDLPIGLVRADPDEGTVTEVKTAVIRELDGYAEEAIHRARRGGSPASFFDAIVKAGVALLGDKPPTDRELQDLYLGDRDFLLLKISEATYGSEIEVIGWPCSNERCENRMDLVVDKAKDIPILKGSLDETEFEVALRGGKSAHVRLSTAADQKATEAKETAAEMNTVVLQRCVETITDRSGAETVVSDDPNAVRSLGIRDRRKILAEIQKRIVGPQYNEVSVTCPECDTESQVVVTLVDLFLGL